VLTLFTTAKPFRGHSAIIQRNALKSWTLLHSGVEVILFGDDEGAAESARELGIRHEPGVERNACGSKRLEYIFDRAQEIASHAILCYANCDIIFPSGLIEAITNVFLEHKQFLMVGRRWDVDVTASIDFASRGWAEELGTQALAAGTRRTAEWIDYFVFRKGLFYRKIPPFVVGRVFWDNWLLWAACRSNIDVVDASACVLAVHQNHDYGYHPRGRAGVWFDEESGQNYRLAGGWAHLRTIADASEVLAAGGLRPNWRRYLEAVKRYVRQAGRAGLYGVFHPVWFFVLGITRPLRSALGLRAANLRRWLQNIQENSP
jgi:hypothetical protein